ncbi:MAG: phosphate signaling complex protein PhoU [Coriobacteriia bacterium]|nr:phosphate signaling complex protein PhoU [Coriobacteriia bacterium]
MREQFRQDMYDIQDDVVDIMNELLNTTKLAVNALIKGDEVVAQEIIDDDDRFDTLTLGIEERVIELIATQFPVARDLRFLMSMSFIAMYQERIGDYAQTIAKSARRSADKPVPQPLIDLIKAQANLVYRVMDATREALEERDLELALKLPELDEPVDSLNKQFYRELGRLTDEDEIEAASKMVMSARALERIADYCVDTGERLAYFLTGERDLLDAVEADLEPQKVI